MSRLSRLLAALTALLGGSVATASPADVANAIAAYERGDYPIALEGLEKAADKGDPQALYNLGLYYSAGKATIPDIAKAAALYERAARKGSVLAGFSLGQMYRKGQGIPADLSKAARWYENAAKRGHFRAANELGLLYVQGQGVKEDLVEGFAWIYPATHASIMDEVALKNATQLAGMLSREQIETAQARGRRYFERYMAPHQSVVRALLGR